MRTVKTTSGATAVQVVWSSRRGSREIEHLGRAHDEAELKALKAAAQQRIAAGQQELALGLEPAGGGPLPVTASEMSHLVDSLERAYRVLGFEEAAGGDEMFRHLVLARIIEPSSKLDSLRVLDEAGVAHASYRTLKRRLSAYAEEEWRQRLSGACAAHARLGPANGETAGARTIEVLPFNNQTLQPRLGDAATQALRERLQSDGTYRLATDGQGDIVVSATIVRYNRQPLSYLNTDVATPQNYRVGVVAHVVVRERASGKILLNKNVAGNTLVNVGTDLMDGERQAAPLLAEDLAHNIAGLITEGAW